MSCGEIGFVLPVFAARATARAATRRVNVCFRQSRSPRSSRGAFELGHDPVQDGEGASEFVKSRSRHRLARSARVRRLRPDIAETLLKRIPHFSPPAGLLPLENPRVQEAPPARGRILPSHANRQATIFYDSNGVRLGSREMPAPGARPAATIAHSS
jgi:hypothetical protein